MLLQIAAAHQIELLVRAAKLDIAFQSDGIITLRDGVHEFVQGDGLFVLKALMKVLAFEHLGHRELREQFDEVIVGELVEPLGVEAHLGFAAVEDLEDLLLIGERVGGDLLSRERLARHVLAGGIADQRRGIAHQEDDLMAEVLEVLQLAHQHRVTQVQIGCGGVEAGFNAQRNAGAARLFEPGTQGVGSAVVDGGDDLGCALGDQVELLFNRGKGVRGKGKQGGGVRFYGHGGASNPNGES